jgi:CubicO group peptidase (beta-lactamase class C family)
MSARGLPAVLLVAALVSPLADTPHRPSAAGATNGDEKDGLAASGDAAPAGPRQAASTVAAADAAVAAWVEAEGIPGAVLLVSRDDRIVLEKAYGWAQLYEYRDGQYGAAAAGTPRPTALRRLAEPPRMTTETVFDLASVTKVMATTFAAMLLVETGELDLDAPVHTYLPDFRGAGKERITPRHLLTHRAGLAAWQPVYYRAQSARQAYEYIRDLPLAWGVGEERHYSDLGFMVLGLLVERVAGEPLGAFLDERLWGPLGLASIGFQSAPAGAPPRPGALDDPGGPRPPATVAPAPVIGPIAATSHGNPYEHRMVHDATFGYRYDGDPDAWAGWRRYTLAGEVNDGNAFHAFGGAAGHAGLFATAADLRVLLQLLLNRGEYGGRRYLSPEVVETFLAPAGDGQALGWQAPANLPAGSFAHPGFTGTWVLGVPAEGLAVVLLTNRQNLGVDERGYYPDLVELQQAVAAIARPLPER